MRPRIAVMLCAILAIALGAGRAAGQPAEIRIALVIGNGAYQVGPTLANPVNDARAMAAKLRALGFEVIGVENGSQQQMRRAIGQFSNRLRPDAVSLFYYAGHGMQVNGHNYLIPVDAEISSEQTVRLETIDVDAVIDQMAVAKTRINLVILDACRNNPYERRFRGQSGGLASIEAPTGTLIAYATSPGRVAADGDRGNGLYTAELLAAVDLPGAKVEDVFKRVRARVVERSRGDQTPWESSSLTGDFYFVPAALAAAPASRPATAASPADRDVVFWTSVKDSRNPALLQAYLDQFPQGTFAGLARIMIADLQRATAPVPSPPGPPPPGPPPPAPLAAPPPPPVQTAVVAPPPIDTLDGRWSGKGASYQISIEIRQRHFTGTMVCGGSPFRMKGDVDANNKIKGEIAFTSMLKLVSGEFPRLLVYAGNPLGTLTSECGAAETVTLSRTP